MPSGYTNSIYEGKETSFASFASGCAHAFGALVTLRDENFSEELPDKLEPSSHYGEKLKELESELIRLQGLTREQCEVEANEQYNRTVESAKTHLETAKAMRQRYEAMLEKAKAWQPPSEEHTGLKEFMIEQLTEGMRFDCSTRFWVERIEQPKLSGEEWQAQGIAKVQKDLSYYRNAYSEEIERTAARNLWIQQLRDSLAEPDTTHSNQRQS